MDSPLPIMRGRYCRRHPILNFAMQCVDTILSLCLPLRLRGGEIKPPRRILISNLAHLGDLVVATSILPVLKSAFPECRIGFLIGSWGQPALLGHPLVDDIHILDHWSASRASLTRWQKWRHYRRSRRHALREVKAAHYDVALDLCWTFPNTLPFLWQARIPVRIGYASGGFGPLATHCLEFDARPQPVALRHLALVERLPVRGINLAVSASNLPPVSAADAAALDQELQKIGVNASDYIVLHIGAGLGLNHWPQQRWRQLAERLAEDHQQLVFTGSGAQDEAIIRQVIRGLPGCINMCGLLSWRSFVAAISRASLLLCVDTVASHIAAAVGTPCAVVVTGRHPYLWHTPGRQCAVLMHPVSCAPCHRGLGCARMECLRDIEVEAVYQAGRTLMSENRRDCAVH